MSGLGEQGANSVYLWDGASAPRQVLNNIAFRHSAFAAEREWAVFCGLEDSILYVMSADGTILSQTAYVGHVLHPESAGVDSCVAKS
jgi:hypothetical protein